MIVLFQLQNHFSLDYIELKIQIREYSPLHEVLKQELADIGFDSFEDHPESISAFVSSSIFSKHKLDHIANSYKNFIGELEYVKHPYQNWNKLWESNFNIVKINENCIIRASFHDSESLDYELIIDPEMSFGTGHHETTRMIAKALFDHNLKGKSVLDFGCGTGVLSILCEKLGAEKIDAIEIEEQSFKNAQKNAIKNNCKKILFTLGDGNSIPSMAYDLLLVNINKNTILSEFKNLVKSIKKESIILFSGFFDADLLGVIKEGQRNGLNKLYSSSENNWALLAMKY